MQILEREKTLSATNTHRTEPCRLESMKKESFEFQRSGSGLNEESL